MLPFRSVLGWFCFMHPTRASSGVQTDRQRDATKCIISLLRSITSYILGRVYLISIPCGKCSVAMCSLFLGSGPGDAASNFSIKTCNVLKKYWWSETKSDFVILKEMSGKHCDTTHLVSDKSDLLTTKVTFASHTQTKTRVGTRVGRHIFANRTC